MPKSAKSLSFAEVGVVLYRVLFIIWYVHRVTLMLLTKVERDSTRGTTVKGIGEDYEHVPRDSVGVSRLIRISVFSSFGGV